MKKILAMILALMLIASLSACGGNGGNTDIPEITAPNNNSGSADPTDATASSTADAYSYVVNGVTLTPGAAFDSSKLPASLGIYTIPSCALDGTDNVYQYETFEVTAYNDGSGEIVYSIYITDPNTATPEGLMQGDDLAKVTSLYGTGYVQDGTAYTYTKGSTSLRIILQNGFVTSIEYLLVV